MAARRAQRGFTLMEIVLVVAIMGLLAAIAVPSFARLKRQNRIREVTRDLVGTLREARSLAAKGGELPGNSNERVRVAGVRITGPSTYAVFVDPDDDANSGNETTVRQVDLLLENPATQAQIVAPVPGTEVRFRNDGRARQEPDLNAAIRVVIADNGLGASRIIEISGVGHARMVDAVK